MERKELLAVLILAALVGLVAVLRIVQVPSGLERRPRRPTSRAGNGAGGKKAEADTEPSRLRLLWPHPREKYVPRAPEARAWFDAAEQVMAEACVEATEAEHKRTLFMAAMPIYQRFIERYGAERTVEVARFRIAQCLTLSNRYAEAAEAYDSFLAEHPQSPLRAMALLWSGDSHANAGNQPMARARFAAVIESGPDFLAADARRRLAQMEEGEKKPAPSGVRGEP
ncbi:MAG: tetratricopeptide repeat protein [Candidatus Brocadiae bacterium]|nr:tetratricopeptide repeat protein [Candidatus Brocadiia bacterium]